MDLPFWKFVLILDKAICINLRGELVHKVLLNGKDVYVSASERPGEATIKIFQ